MLGEVSKLHCHLSCSEKVKSDKAGFSHTATFGWQVRRKQQTMLGFVLKIVRPDVQLTSNSTGFDS